MYFTSRSATPIITSRGGWLNTSLGRVEVAYGGVEGEGWKKRRKRDAGKAEGGTAVSFNDMLHFPEREESTRKERTQERVLFYNAVSPLLQQIAFHWSFISQPHGFLTAKPINTQIQYTQQPGFLNFPAK